MRGLLRIHPNWVLYPTTSGFDICWYDGSTLTAYYPRSHKIMSPRGEATLKVKWKFLLPIMRAPERTAQFPVLSRRNTEARYEPYNAQWI